MPNFAKRRMQQSSMNRSKTRPKETASAGEHSNLSSLKKQIFLFIGTQWGLEAIVIIAIEVASISFVFTITLIITI